MDRVCSSKDKTEMEVALGGTVQRGSLRPWRCCMSGSRHRVPKKENNESRCFSTTRGASYESHTGAQIETGGL